MCVVCVWGDICVALVRLNCELGRCEHRKCLCVRGRGRLEFIKHTSALIVTKYSLTLELGYMFVYAPFFILPYVFNTLPLLVFPPSLSLSLSLSLPPPPLSDDLMQLVAKLEQQSGSSDGSCRVARQILDFFELHVGDYRMNQVLYLLVLFSG